MSRILAEHLMGDAIIVCIDETGFRSDTVKEKKWQFNSYVKKSTEKKFSNENNGQ